MKRTKLKQREKTLTECIKSLEKMKSTNESVIVIEVKEFPKEVLEVLEVLKESEERKQILN